MYGLFHVPTGKQLLIPVIDDVMLDVDVAEQNGSDSSDGRFDRE